jgi:transcriptional regulator with XRE-family HTH domain
MQSEDIEFGRRISEHRELLGLSLRGLATRAGVSSGFLSQLENGHARASIGSLRKLAVALGVSVADLLETTRVHSRGVVRAAERPHYEVGEGSTKYVVTQTPLRNLEIYTGVFEPGGSTGDEQYSHGKAQEVFLVTSGRVELHLGDEVIVMDQNDSIEYLSSVPHRVINTSDARAEVIWVTSPPTVD